MTYYDFTFFHLLYYKVLIKIHNSQERQSGGVEGRTPPPPLNFGGGLNPPPPLILRNFFLIDHIWYYVRVISIQKFMAP